MGQIITTAGRGRIVSSFNYNLINGLVSYWDFDNSILDTSSKAGDFTAYGTVQYVQGLEPGTSALNTLGDGTNYIQATKSFDLSTSFTISVWVKPSVAPSVPFIIFGGTEFFSYGMAYTPVPQPWGQHESTAPPYGNLYISNQGNSHDTWNNIPYLQLGKWTHIVMKRTGPSHIAAWANGQQLTQSWTEPFADYSTSTLGIGKSYGTYTAGYQFIGSIARLGIWNTELSNADISNLYNGGNGLSFSRIRGDGTCSIK